jgi:hypothetical protein
MEQKELQLLVSAGVLDHACIFKAHEGYELWVYGEWYNGDNVLKTQRKQKRKFASIDAAFAVLLACGFKGEVKIDAYAIQPAGSV